MMGYQAAEREFATDRTTEPAAPSALALEIPLEITWGKPGRRARA